MRAKDSIAADTSSLPLDEPDCLFVGQRPSEWLRANQAGREFRYDAGSKDILIWFGGVGPIALNVLSGMLAHFSDR